MSKLVFNGHGNDSGCNFELRGLVHEYACSPVHFDAGDFSTKTPLPWLRYKGLTCVLKIRFEFKFDLLYTAIDLF